MLHQGGITLQGNAQRAGYALRLRGSSRVRLSLYGNAGPRAIEAGVTDGTALFVTAERGNEHGTPLSHLEWSNSSVCGLTIYYPEQIADSEPEPYPWATSICAARTLPPFDARVAGTSIRASMQAVHRAPQYSEHYRAALRRGIWVDAIYDIGRVEERTATRGGALET